MENSISGLGAGRFPDKADALKREQNADIFARSGDMGVPEDKVELSKNGVKDASKQGSSETKNTVKVKILPQDPKISKPEVIEIEKDKIGTSLEGKRMKVVDNTVPVAIADTDGNYLSYNLGDPQFDQVNAFVTANNTLDMHEAFFGRKLQWQSKKDVIEIHPHYSEGQHTCYNHTDVKLEFSSFESMPLNKKINIALSADAISHETGHAILDGLRPLFLRAGWDDETMAYHEAFADTTSMLYTLTDQENLKEIAKETGGDLSKNSRLVMMCEEFGEAIKRENNDPSDDKNTYTRTLINNFKYTDPKDLPYGGSDEEMGSEFHGFSRIMSGAVYDCFRGIYEKKLDEVSKNSGTDKYSEENVIRALEESRDTIGPIFAKSVDLLPPATVKFKQAALSMIKTDELLNKGENREILEKAFLGRNIISKQDLELFDNLAGKLDILTTGKIPENSKEALEFLKENADALSVKPESINEAKVYKDSLGNTVIQLSQKEEHPYNGSIPLVAGLPQEEKPYIDITGGTTIVFDADGKPVSIADDLITPEHLGRATKSIEKAVKNGAFIGPTGVGELGREDIRYAGEVYYEPDKPKISLSDFIIRSDDNETGLSTKPAGKYKIRRNPLMK